MRKNYKIKNLKINIDDARAPDISTSNDTVQQANVEGNTSQRMGKVKEALESELNVKNCKLVDSQMIIDDEQRMREEMRESLTSLERSCNMLQQELNEARMAPELAVGDRKKVKQATKETKTDNTVCIVSKDFASDEEWLLPRNNEVLLVERLPPASHRPQLVAPKIERLELAEFETGLSALWQTGKLTASQKRALDEYTTKQHSSTRTQARNANTIMQSLWPAREMRSWAVSRPTPLPSLTAEETQRISQLYKNYHKSWKTSEREVRCALWRHGAQNTEDRGFLNAVDQIRAYHRPGAPKPGLMTFAKICGGEEMQVGWVREKDIEAVEMAYGRGGVEDREVRLTNQPQPTSIAPAMVFIEHHVIQNLNFLRTWRGRAPVGTRKYGGQPQFAHRQSEDSRICGSKLLTSSEKQRNIKSSLCIDYQDKIRDTFAIDVTADKTHTPYSCEKSRKILSNAKYRHSYGWIIRLSHAMPALLLRTFRRGVGQQKIGGDLGKAISPA
uniref:Uncharacterized protein n=1 Tax=Branchiostoma floridae TaxID=7739 RepID=C3ZB16_BRAFL|eukprot:XP_002594042.1 hypothetical protein BRAFLDRAFT_68518 [Branchiostoma floridae]